MKTKVLASTAIAIATTFALPAISQSQTQGKVEYFCQVSNGIPITFARIPSGTVEMIGWQSRTFNNSGYSPERRCQEVTARFQKHSDAGNLRFITTGKMNNQNVMCVAQKKGGNCIPDGLLLTFESNEDPQKIVAELFNVSTRKRKIRLTRGKPIYINVEEYLQNTSSVRPSQPNEPENEAPPQENCDGSFFCNN